MRVRWRPPDFEIPMVARSWIPWLLPGIAGATLLATGAAAFADDTQGRSPHVLELQFGGGVLSTPQGTGPLAQAHFRFALWRTIGLGLYAGASWIGDDYLRTAIPVAGRLNLSLPFWRDFEPMLSVGVGPLTYFVRTSTRVESEGTAAAHLALSLLFPHHRSGFGIEGAVHVAGDARYPTTEPTLLGTLAVSVLAR